MEQKCARTTCRVEDPLVQRVGDGSTDDLIGQPVRRVALAELLAGLRPDHRFVEDLQHVVLNVGPVEASQASGESADEGVAAGNLQHPVEEVTLDNAVNSGEVEPLPAEQR